MISNTYQNNLDNSFQNNIQINHNISLNFLPTKDSLPTNLMDVKVALDKASMKNFQSIKIVANSGLILLLIPLLIPVKDRLRIEFCFEADSPENLYDSCYRSCKNFKDILEAANVLTNIGIDVCFSKTMP